MLQTPKYFIIIANCFSYIDNQLTEKRCLVPLDLNIIFYMLSHSTMDFLYAVVIMLFMSTVAENILL